MPHTCKTGGCGIFKSLHPRGIGAYLVFLPDAIEHHSRGGTSLVLIWGSKSTRFVWTFTNLSL